MTRESAIEKYLVRRVIAMGGVIRKVKWIGRRHAPDRRVMLRGKCCWVELKAPGKLLEPGQAREHVRMKKYGEKVYVFDSFEAVDEFMEGRL